MDNITLLNKLYYNDLIMSLDTLYKKAKQAHPKLTKAYVKEWFNQQQSVQLNNKPVGKTIYKPIYAEQPYSFQIDLTFFPRYTKQNNGYYVLFTAINVNTRFGYAYYSKNKEMQTILDF